MRYRRLLIGATLLCVVGLVPGGGAAAQTAWYPGAPPVLGVESFDGAVRLRWSRPTNDGESPITDYVIQFSLSGVRWATYKDGVSIVLGRTVRGLRNGTSYRFRVAARNAAGTGSFSPVQQVLVGLPGRPRFLAPSSRDHGMKLQWTAPVLPGASPVLDYAVQYSANGMQWTDVVDAVSVARTTTVTGLSNDQALRFRVAAVNAIGRGPFSVATLARPSPIRMFAQNHCGQRVDRVTGGGHPGQFIYWLYLPSNAPWVLPLHLSFEGLDPRLTHSNGFFDFAPFLEPIIDIPDSMPLGTYHFMFVMKDDNWVAASAPGTFIVTNVSGPVSQC